MEAAADTWTLSQRNFRRTELRSDTTSWTEKNSILKPAGKIGSIGYHCAGDADKLLRSSGFDSSGQVIYPDVSYPKQPPFWV